MARMIPIVQHCSVPHCPVKATHRVLDIHGNQKGYYCYRHAQREVKHLNQVEAGMQGWNKRGQT